MKIKISHQAYEDLEDIYNYSLEKWSAEIAEDYRLSLDQHFKMIADFPQIGRVLRGIYRSFPIGRHIIIYRVSNESIFITRIRAMPDILSDM